MQMGIGEATKTSLTVVEVRRAVNVFQPALVSFTLIDCYWLPRTRRVAIRVVETQRKSRVLPTGAIHIGRYRHPWPRPLFVADLSCAAQE